MKTVYGEKIEGDSHHALTVALWEECQRYLTGFRSEYSRSQQNQI